MLGRNTARVPALLLIIRPQSAGAREVEAKRRGTSCRRRGGRRACLEARRAAWIVTGDIMLLLLKGMEVRCALGEELMALLLLQLRGD